MKCTQPLSNDEIIRHLEQPTPEEIAHVNRHIDHCDECAARMERLAGSVRPNASVLPPNGLPSIEGYDLQKEIGRGGMGVVYQARSKLNRKVALKLILAGGLSSVDELRRFRREAEMAASLSHPNIVQIYDRGECRGVAFISMELIEGQSLEQVLSPSRTMPARPAARLLSTISRAVHYAHQRRVLHRDLKPGNIIIDGASEPHVADFGLARRLEAEIGLAPPSAIEGTPEYMAPEQIARAPVSAATDVHALGGILYRVLAGRPPYQGGSRIETMTQVLDHEPVKVRDLNPAVDRDLETICLKCLQKEPGKRYSSAAAFADDLDRWIGGEPISARRASRFERARRWCRRNPARAGLVALVPLSLLAMTLAAVVLWRQELERRTTAERLVETEQQKRETDRLAAHAARVTAARTLAGRGNWIAAMPEFDRAIADGEPDALALRVERLVGYFALNQTDRLTAELDELGRADMGQWAAQVRLLQGTWLLCDMGRSAEGRKLVQQALADRDTLLSDADRAYAEALAAEQIGAAIRALRRAVAADPLHYLASSTLAVALAMGGDVAEARRQSRFLRGVFPASPMPDLADALAALMDGDAGALKTCLTGMSARLPESRRADVARVQEALAAILELQKIGVRAMANDQPNIPAELARAAKMLLRVRDLSGTSAEPLGLPVPAVGMLYQRLLDVLAINLELGRLMQFGTVPAAVLARGEALCEDYPEALMLTMVACGRLRLAVDPLNRGDIPVAHRELARSAALASRATQAPCVLPRSPVGYMARGLGVIADVGVLKLVRQPDPIHYRRLRDNLHLLVADGAAWPKLRRPLLAMLIQLTAAPLTADQFKDWQIDTAEGKAACRVRVRELAQQARMLLDDWAIDEPGTAEIPRLRAQLEKWASSPGLPPAK
jgi:hypothetical protein